MDLIHIGLMIVIIILSINGFRYYDMDKKAAKAAGTFSKEDQKKKIWRILIPVFSIVFVLIVFVYNVMKGGNQVRMPRPIARPMPVAPSVPSVPAPTAGQLNPQMLAQAAKLLQQGQKGGAKPIKTFLKKLLMKK